MASAYAAIRLFLLHAHVYTVDLDLSLVRTNEDVGMPVDLPGFDQIAALGRNANLHTGRAHLKPVSYTHLTLPTTVPV